MSDKSSGIGGNLPPVLRPDMAPDPEDSFLDDVIGAERMRRIAAKKKASEERPKTDPEERVEQYRKVREASRFERARDDDELGRRQQRLQDVGARAGDGLNEVSGKDIRQQAAAETLSANETAVTELMHEIHALLDQIDVLGGLDVLDEAARQVLDKEGAWRRGQDKDQVGRLAANLARLRGLNNKLLRAESQVKQQLQQLLSGSTGLAFLADPRNTFKRLLTGIKKWPRRIRPGRRPESDDELDAFIAWVFEPPAPPPLENGDDDYHW